MPSRTPTNWSAFLNTLHSAGCDTTFPEASNVLSGMCDETEWYGAGRRKTWRITKERADALDLAVLVLDYVSEFQPEKRNGPE
jgi:hypothetical protein